MKNKIQDLVDDIKEGFPAHFTDVNEIDRVAFEKMMHLADTLLINWDKPPLIAPEGMRNIGLMFYQPSTRTRLSFEVAARKLGFNTMGFSDYKTTRAGDYYEESLADVIRVFSTLCDCLVIRHFESGIIHSNRTFSFAPVISAGDGYFQHPTQAIGDVYTMTRCLKRLDGKRIGFIGDPNVRSIKSISMLLSNYDVALFYLLPPNTEFPDDLDRFLISRQIKPAFVKDAAELFRKVDLVETIGVNHPKHNVPYDKQSTKIETPKPYRITYGFIEQEKARIPILHPGPRTDELQIDKPTYSSCQYFDQVKYGTLMRMVLFLLYMT